MLSNPTMYRFCIFPAAFLAGNFPCSYQARIAQYKSKFGINKSAPAANLPQGALSVSIDSVSDKNHVRPNLFKLKIYSSSNAPV